VAENVGYALRVRRVARAEARRRLGEVLEAAGLDGLARLRPDELSTLQRRRVELTRARMAEPDLLILDEPFARIGPRERIEFREEIRRLVADGDVTVMVLTADPREALAQADRLAVMDLGRIVQVGTPAELYNRPVDTFVAQLLGPANLLHGQLEGTDARGDAIVRTPIGRLIGSCPRAPLAAGAAVTVAIRPEALALAIGATAATDANRFVATIERQVFQGETRELVVRGPGDWPLTALALQGPSQGLREGQSLTLTVPPHSVLVLPSRVAAATQR
jgi:ABC-type Fe3+/spermidine/putrescine transport system ATPase subunit